MEQPLKKLLDQVRGALRLKHRIVSPCGTIPIAPMSLESIALW